MSYYRSVILRDSPVAYYRLGEPSGTTAKDETGNYNGIYNGTYTQGQSGAILGDINGAALFDGSTGYVACPSGLDPTGWSAFTCECRWYYMASNHGGRIISNGHVDVGDNGFQMALNTSSGGIASIQTTNKQVNLFWSSANFAVGVRYHYALTYDGSHIYSYLNSAQTGNDTLTGTIVSSGLPVNIGRGSYNNDYIQAVIDEVVVYNRGLSIDQISNHYHAGLGMQVGSLHRFYQDM